MDTNEEEMKAEVARNIRLWAIPIDFEQLEKAGVLTKVGAWYRVHKFSQLPEHARVKITSTAEDKKGMKFKFSKVTKKMQQLAERLDPRY